MPDATTDGNLCSVSDSLPFRFSFGPACTGLIDLDPAALLVVGC